ncbi:hypothetical protein LAZ67_1006162 [Cordylochernes scorpioides]|uniref:Reverse transcriptase domain-containing protein n=1 Tax=Cordylochernes scorpioides TaxID=51811 RepID=A0ABY6JYJ2_9ARAC|nr:hypothetical protein LAZ67_1006162 [Cordylochernes scorpioides]
MNPSAEDLPRYTYQLRKKSLQLSRWRLHLNFNKLCETADFIPPSLRIRDPVRNPFSSVVIRRAQFHLLSSRIKGCHSNIRFISESVKGLIFLVSQLLTNPEMADLLQSITRDIRHQKNDITQRHNSKLHHWIKKYNFPAYLLEAYLPQSPQGVVNLSDYVLPSADAEILSLGLKYRLPGPSDIPRIIAGVEPALRGLNHQDTHRIRHFVTSTLQRPYNIPKPSLAMNRVISRLKRNRDIVITKSDKGSQTVILNTTVYKQKMQNVLDQHSIFSAITEQEHKTSVKNFRLLLLRLKRSQQITKEQYNDFTANLAQIAYIYGLPKIHKPDVPLRPIISYHLSPAYTLSKFLSNFLTPLLQSPPWEYTIANSPSFVSYITSLTPPPRSIMVSFDVTSLYLSLAHPLIINSLRTFLENAPLLDTLTAETVVELTSICLGMSTFTFDTQFFKQTKGSPMGSPLSTVVAEVVMRSLDQWITSRHSSDIFLWRRYIDDTFCLVSEVSASHILSDLNSFHPDIAFTHETENHSVLPFLDTLVIRTPSSFHTTVYYKNNTPPHHTNFRSHCPTPHKINTVRALTKRIFTHCSLPLFQTIEKAKIFSYLSKSGYPTPFILKHMHDPHHNSAPAIHRNICSLPFCPQSITIARFLRQHGITTYFQNPPNIATLIRHPITRSSLHASSLRSGGAVYSVSCDQCNATYVGETGIPLIDNAPDFARTSKMESLLNDLFPDDDISSEEELHKATRYYSPIYNNRNKVSISLKDIESIIVLLKNQKAPGSDNISNNMIIYAYPRISIILHQIFEKCISLGYFQDYWKNSCVKIIPKGDKTSYDVSKSYRPISLLSNISKIFENVIKNKLTTFYDENNLMSHRQHGFSRHKSTITSMKELTETILEHKQRELKALIAVDLSGAFDNAWWPAIIKKNGFIQRCLSYGGKTVSKNLTKGCPQGSPLSPLLWNILLNDILMNFKSTNAEIICYADDISIICWHYNLEGLKTELVNTLNYVTQWCRSNKLTINPEKTNLINFHNFHRFQLEFQKTVIKPSNEIKILGMKFSNHRFKTKINFTPHINEILHKAHRMKNLLFSLSGKIWGINSNKRLILYKTLIRPILTYGAEIWFYQINNRCKQKLNSMQYQIVLWATRSFKTSSSNCVHCLAEIPFLTDFIESRLIKYELDQLSEEDQQTFSPHSPSIIK